MTDRRRKILVPFDLRSSLRAPYGYTQKMRAADRAKLPPPKPMSRRDRTQSNLTAAAIYGLAIIGGVIGWVEDQTWISVAVGAGVGVSSMVMLFPFALGVARIARWLHRHTG